MLIVLDDTATDFVLKQYAHRQSIVKLWTELTAIIVKVDLLRYLAILSEGGVYGDIDTSCLLPVSEWIPSEFDPSHVNAIVGIEYDDNTYPMFVRPISFTQWALIAKPHHPIFEAVVDRVVGHLEYISRMQRKTLSEMVPNKAEVLEATGPGCFTDAVLQVMTDMTGRHYTFDDFHGLKKPVLVGDILVMPVRAFASGQKHSQSNDPAYGTPLVKHHFSKSWY